MHRRELRLRGFTATGHPVTQRWSHRFPQTKHGPALQLVPLGSGVTLSPRWLICMQLPLHRPAAACRCTVPDLQPLGWPQVSLGSSRRDPPAAQPKQAAVAQATSAAQASIHHGLGWSALPACILRVQGGGEGAGGLT